MTPEEIEQAVNALTVLRNHLDDLLASHAQLATAYVNQRVTQVAGRLDKLEELVGRQSGILDEAQNGIAKNAQRIDKASEEFGKLRNSIGDSK